MSNWDGYKPAPIEVFHGEAMKQFHARRNELGRSPDEGLNGIEVNNILAVFKRKIMEEYNISGDAIPVEEKPS